MIRILIADDTNLIRQALNIYFKLDSNLEIVGTADNGKTALKLIEELNPDIVLMDMEMPEMDGLTATQIIRQRFPKTKVLIISSHNSQDYIDKALTAGANGYFIKSRPTEELSEAIKLIYTQDVKIIPNVSTGGSYLVLSDSLPHPDQTKSKLASLPLITIDKFLPSIEWWINRRAIVLISMFGVAIFLASILKYKITVTAKAQIQANSDIAFVQAPIEGKIESITVTENQSVEVGETIATISKSQLQEQKSQSEQSIQQRQEQIRQLDNQIEDLDRQIASKVSVTRSPLRETRAALQEQKIPLQQQLKRDRQTLQQINSQLQDTNIRAPIAGTIQKLYLHNRQQLVHSGDLIAKISPSPFSLIVKASVASQDIARVEKEQKVQLRVFACPDRHYGTLKGKIIAISPPISQSLPADNQLITDREQNINSVPSTYEVTIEPDRLSLHKNNRKCPLKSGMKARADIIIREETILASLLRQAK